MAGKLNRVMAERVAVVWKPKCQVGVKRETGESGSHQSGIRLHLRFVPYPQPMWLSMSSIGPKHDAWVYDGRKTGQEEEINVKEREEEAKE